MDRDVFIISIAQSRQTAQAIRQAMQEARVDPSHVQDVIFGLDGSGAIDAGKILTVSSLTCSAATVSSSLRAAFFAAQSALSGDLEVLVVVGLDDQHSTTMLLASPDAVGRWNLMPRARLAARSLKGIESTLRAAEIDRNDVTVLKAGKCGAALIKETLEELEGQSGRWGLVTVNESALLIERI
ncbi:MAG TPA: hypothetical protein VLZ89_17030 [Anaerolineales bacterium]|nr:hypothetical protein [Anaerolineales bacterium]